MKNRDFTYKGIKFYLNDNVSDNVIFLGAKYILYFWNKEYKSWQPICAVDTKKEAKQFVKEYLEVTEI